MKISVITVVYNNERTIRSAIDSVLMQDHPDIEYIVIDGGSKDRTVEIVRSYGPRISKFVSEPDKGIYDAMNKGLRMATGEYLGILNSDDFYIHNKVISNVARELQNKKTDSLFADLIYVDAKDEKQVRYWRSGEFRKGSFKKGWHPPHPTFFVRNSVYRKYGYFDLSLRLSADFELMLRFLEKHGISTCYLPEPLIKMRLGGATNKSLKNIIKQNHECIRSFRMNGLKVSPLYPLYRLLPKLTQYFTKK